MVFLRNDTLTLVPCLHDLYPSPRWTWKTSGRAASGKSSMLRATSMTSSTTAARRSTQTSPTPFTSGACHSSTPSTSSSPASSSLSSQCWFSISRLTVERRSRSVSPSCSPSLCSCSLSPRPSPPRRWSSRSLESTYSSQWSSSPSASSSPCSCWTCTIARRWPTPCRIGCARCFSKCCRGLCWCGDRLMKTARLGGWTAVGR